LKTENSHIWRLVQEDGVSAAYGLAADEYFTSTYAADQTGSGATLRLYTYRNYCGLVGRFQNIYAELDLEACRAEDVQIGRRLTGGGAIIMGRDQLGICLASHSKNFEWKTIRDLCALLSVPVVKALAQLGVNANFRSKNDLEVGGKKIAGLGVYVDPHGAFHFHTSLLVDLDIPQMLKVLRIPVQKFADKQKVEAVAQRITTVSREVGRKVAIEEVRQLLREQYKAHFEVQLQEHAVSAGEQPQIERIAEERYRNEEWLYQRSPQADMTGMSLKKTAAGLLRIYIGLKGETIKSVLITGDFLEDAGMFNLIEAKLKWSPLEKDAIGRAVQEVFAQNDIQYLPSPADVADAIWTAAQRAHATQRYTYQGSCYYPAKSEE
jgi:lipoate---protein ligase